MSADIPFGDFPEQWSHISIDGPWVRVPYNDQFIKDEYDRIREGYIPESMDEKWIVFSGEEWTWACRSWGGDCVYAYRFETDGDIVTMKDAYISLSCLSEDGRNDPAFILNGTKAILRCYILEEDDAFLWPSLPYDSDSNNET